MGLGSRAGNFSRAILLAAHRKIKRKARRESTTHHVASLGTIYQILTGIVGSGVMKTVSKTKANGSTSGLTRV